MIFFVGTWNEFVGRSRALPERSPRGVPSEDCGKEGAHGGTMGSPVLEPVREPASA
jgi:hypothetical protein